ncbi:integrase arm-type DNA-binding domain-containing protein [Francisellaceae bacterium CB299]
MSTKVTDSKVKSLKYKDIKSMSLGDRLNIKIDKKDNKYFFYLYTLNGKRTTIGIGSYPTTSLKQARDKAFEYNQMLASGKNPKLEKEKAKHKDDGIFANVAQEALDSRHPSKPNGWTETTYKKNISIYKRYIMPILKSFQIADIEPRQISQVLLKETPNNQQKIKAIFNCIFGYAVSKKGLCNYNIAREIKADAVKTKGFDFVNPIEDRYNFSKLLNDIDGYKGQYNTAMALKLAVLIGFRPNNIATLKWESIKETKIKNKVIHYISLSADDMKMSRDFRQPLSKQAYNILMKMKEYNGGCEYVFYSTSSKDRHITKDSLSKALRETLGYNGIYKPKQVTHGFRKSARTYISSIQSDYNWSSDAIRMILSHSKENAIDNIYDKNDFLSERSQMLQLWADYVDDVKTNSNVINMDNVG